MGEAFFAIAFVTSIMFLIAQSREKRGRASGSGLSAERLDSISYRTIAIGFPLFTEGLMFVFMTLVLIAKPSGLLNIADYWTPLLTMLDRIAEQRFMTREQHELLLVDADAARLLDRLAKWRPPRVLAGTRP